MANLGALLHFLIVSHALAVVRTLVKNFGAGTAGKVVKIGFAQHEAGIDLADIDAIQQEAHMGLFSVFPAHLQAVLQCLGASLMAARAVLD